MLREKIKEIYEEIVRNGVYDQAYENSLEPEIIDGKMHGICLHFSNALIRKLNENGILATLISTLNDDGYLHAAVLYEEEYEEEYGTECFIADPVTDIKMKVELENNENPNYSNRRNVSEYVKQFGEITIYKHGSLEQFATNLEDEKEILEKLEDVFLKRRESCSTLSYIGDVDKYADGPTKLACRTLYEKGIETFCSNYKLGKEISINCRYNSLSEENKKILEKAMLEDPDKYFVSKAKGFYGHLGNNDEITQNQPMQLTFGFSELSNNFNQEDIEEKMNALASIFQKQIYKHGVYSKEEILQNKHNLLATNSCTKEVKECTSNATDTNEKIASNENLIYSKKYDMFFENYEVKSRYLESLYRKENDERNEIEIAKDSGMFYSIDNHMFFEDEKEAIRFSDKSLEKEEYIISSTDIVRATKESIGQKIIRKIKEIFSKDKNYNNVGGR